MIPVTIYKVNSIQDIEILESTSYQEFNSYKEAFNYLKQKNISYKTTLEDLSDNSKVVVSRLNTEEAQLQYGSNKGYTIYQKTSVGKLQLYPYTNAYQFSTYEEAEKYLDFKSYNANATLITNLSLKTAKGEYLNA
jgi:hypothetical protein